MSLLLVLTVGQTDVQLVDGAGRRELDSRKCALQHDEIERREGEWRFADSPSSKLEPVATSLPQGAFSLCTPKLDAVLRYLAEQDFALTAALILETRRDAEAAQTDPRFAGTVLARRLKGQGLLDVRQVTFLAGRERLEDREDPRGAIIRGEILSRIDEAVRNCLAELKPARVIISATGGFPAVSNLVEEVVRLHAFGVSDNIDSLEVADGAKATPPTHDRAVSRQRTPEPAASYQARRHALELIDKGNLLGAWGAVQHFHEDQVEHHWTQVIEWLARFASSTPIPPDCDIHVLSDQRMAVRAGLRVELSLRAGDIPRAVHGTVAFFESALWDHLRKHLSRHPDTARRLYKADPRPLEKLVATDREDHKPFELVDEIDGERWYRVCDGKGCGSRLAKRYLHDATLEDLGHAVDGIRDLRNDVAHAEPTPSLMDEARKAMVDASLWSPGGRFLSQPLVQSVLSQIGEPNPDTLYTRVVSAVRERLLRACPR